MDYTNILQELEEASLFDLYRLRAAIDNEMDNSHRIGQEITWFDDTTNLKI